MVFVYGIREERLTSGEVFMFNTIYANRETARNEARNYASAFAVDHEYEEIPQNDRDVWQIRYTMQNGIAPEEVKITIAGFWFDDRKSTIGR